MSNLVDERAVKNWATYADGQYRADFIHRVAVRSCTDIGILWFRVFHIELCCNVLNKSLHSGGTAPDAHKLGGKGGWGTKISFLINILTVLFVFLCRKITRALLWRHQTWPAGRGLRCPSWSGRGCHPSVFPGGGCAHRLGWVMGDKVTPSYMDYSTSISGEKAAYVTQCWVVYQWLSLFLHVCSWRVDDDMNFSWIQTLLLKSYYLSIIDEVACFVECKYNEIIKHFFCCIIFFQSHFWRFFLVRF